MPESTIDPGKILRDKIAATVLAGGDKLFRKRGIVVCRREYPNVGEALIAYKPKPEAEGPSQDAISLNHPDDFSPSEGSLVFQHADGVSHISDLPAGDVNNQDYWHWKR